MEDTDQSPESARLTRRKFLTIGCGSLAGGAASCLLAPVYATQVEPRWIEVTRLDVSIPGLPLGLDGVSIAHLSDFHLGRQVQRDQVARAVEIANGLEPDLIVLTGDFVSGAAKRSAACAEELARLVATCGVYAVLGNHDNWTNADLVAANVAAVGITVLRDGAYPIETGDSRLWLLGIEDPGYTAGFFGHTFGDFREEWKDQRLRLAGMLEDLPDGEPRLLLVHNPDFTEMLPEGRIDLALCGHTHGGQVRLPVVGAPVVPSFFGNKYAGGLVRGPKTQVYVSRGIGLIAPAVRFNCRPEVTLLCLRST